MLSDAQSCYWYTKRCKCRALSERPRGRIVQLRRLVRRLDRSWRAEGESGGDCGKACRQ